MISNCRSSMGNDINGDASGMEYRLQAWFDFNSWDCVLRHPDEKVRKYISNFARHAAENNHIGYSMNQRLGMANALINGSPASKGTYDPEDIDIDCAADCSSSTAAIIKAVGYRLGLANLKNVNQSAVTSNMASALVGAGFQKFTGTQYTKSESNLLPGDILLNESSHVCIEVSDSDYDLDSSDSTSTTIKVSAASASTSSTPPIAYNTKGTGVAAIQGALIYLGLDIGRYRDKRGAYSGVDGDNGSESSLTNTKLKEAIQNGKITQKQVDAILEVFK